MAAESSMLGRSSSEAGSFVSMNETNESAVAQGWFVLHDDPRTAPHVPMSQAEGERLFERNMTRNILLVLRVFVRRVVDAMDGSVEEGPDLAALDPVRTKLFETLNSILLRVLREGPDPTTAEERKRRRADNRRVYLLGLLLNAVSIFQAAHDDLVYYRRFNDGLPARRPEDVERVAGGMRELQAHLALLSGVARDTRETLDAAAVSETLARIEPPASAMTAVGVRSVPPKIGARLNYFTGGDRETLLRFLRIARLQHTNESKDEAPDKLRLGAPAQLATMLPELSVSMRRNGFADAAYKRALRVKRPTPINTTVADDVLGSGVYAA